MLASEGLIRGRLCTPWQDTPEQVWGSLVLTAYLELRAKCYSDIQGYMYLYVSGRDPFE